MRLFLPYFQSRFQQEIERKQFMAYVGDSLFYLPQQKYIGKKYSDLAFIAEKKVEVDNRSGDEIAADVIKRLGLKFRDQEEKEGDVC